MRNGKLQRVVSVICSMALLSMQAVFVSPVYAAESSTQNESQIESSQEEQSARSPETLQADESIAISSASDLMAIASDMGGSYVLTNDIDLSGIAWTPLGTSGEAFSGTLDGNGCTIKGLAISGDMQSAGLFAALDGATISNTTFDGVALTQGLNAVGSKWAVIAAEASDSSIENCTVTGTIALSAEYSDSVGGLVASAMNTSFAHDVSNVEITASCGVANIGGICASGNASYDSCENTGNISVSTYNSNFTNEVAGIAVSASVVRNCSNSGDIENQYKSYGVAGYSQIVTGCLNDGLVEADVLASGIAGTVDCYISECTNRGAVTASNGEGVNAGGQVCASGILSSFSATASSAFLSTCTNRGDIYADGGYKLTMQALAAGIIAQTSDGITVDACQNTGGIHTEGYMPYAAGITALLQAGEISRCSNEGVVYAHASNDAISDDVDMYQETRGAAGGIVAEVSGWQPLVANCVNRANVSAVAYVSSPYIVMCAGGIAGSTYDGGDGTAIVRYCWSTGDVYSRGYSERHGSMSVSGALVGRCVATPKHCYYDARSSIDGDSPNTVVGTAISASSLTDESVFPRLDFSSVWTMDEDGPTLDSYRELDEDVSQSNHMQGWSARKDDAVVYGDDGSLLTYGAGYVVATYRFDVNTSEWQETTDLDSTGEILFVYAGQGAYSGTAEKTISIFEQSSIFGEDRYATMSAISNTGFEKSDWVIVATGANFPDALTASALAGIYDCPILLTPQNENISEYVVNEITRLQAKHVVIVGGDASISDRAQSGLEALVGEQNVMRLSGEDRIETCMKIYQQGLDNWGDVCFVTTGKNYPDSLSVSPFAYGQHAPVFLTQDDGTLSNDVLSAISEARFSTIVILGGSASVSDAAQAQLETSTRSAIVRLAGEDRYQTCSAIASWAIENGYLSGSSMTVATGNSYPDALASGPLCGETQMPLLLVSDDNRSALDDYVSENKYSIASCCVVGGLSSVSQNTRDYLAKLL